MKDKFTQGLGVDCPHCGAKTGAYCVRPGQLDSPHHAKRLKLAEQQAQKENAK